MRVGAVPKQGSYPSTDEFDSRTRYQLRACRSVADVDGTGQGESPERAPECDRLAECKCDGLQNRVRQVGFLRRSPACA